MDLSDEELESLGRMMSSEDEDTLELAKSIIGGWNCPSFKTVLTLHLNSRITQLRERREWLERSKEFNNRIIWGGSPNPCGEVFLKDPTKAATIIPL